VPCWACSPDEEVNVTTPESPEALREELTALETQIAEMQQTADDARRDLEETSDKTSAIEAAEQQEAIIAQLDLRRRDLMTRLENA
jgi:predicted  nucleic acid-binding Zn-ribbon protein